MDKHRLAFLFGLSLALLWGLSFLSIKVAIREVPPMTMAAARFVIALAVLPFIARMTGERLAVSRGDLPALAIGGFTGVTLYFYGENNGVSLLTASESSLIISTIPVLTLLAERLFLGVRQGARVYAGAVLSMLGVVLIAARSEGTSDSRMGYLYMGTACAAWVLYGLATQKSASRLGRLSVTFWQLFFGLLGCLPLALREAHAWRVPSCGAVLNILYLGLACSALGYWLYIAILDLIGAGGASIYVNLIPVVAVAGAFVLLRERLTAYQWVGGALAVSGVWLATVRKNRPGVRTAPCVPRGE